jgi:PKD repeat protein
MENPRFHPSRRFLLLAILLAALVLAGRVAAASAATYCVNDPACPAGGVAEGTVNEAIAAADEDVALDTVRIGPGTFHLPNFSAIKPVSIVGSGIGTTVLEDEPSGAGTFAYLTAGCRITDLAIHLTKNGQEGLRLAGGADAARIAVSASHSLKVNTGIFVEGVGSDISSVTVDLGPEISGYAIGDLGESTTIEDANLTAAIGLLPSNDGTTARRLTIHADVGLFLIGGVLNIANALILPYPDEPQNPGFEAADVTGGNGGEGASLAMADTTIVGPGAAHGGSGVDVRSNFSVNTGNVTASLQGVVIDGVAHSIFRQGKSATQTATVSVAYSAYDGARVTDGPGNGELAAAANNLTGGADPRFVDPAAGDYRPRFDSPLLDSGPPMMPLAGDDPDLSGRSRVRDSDGNGSAIREIGAYEYQRLAPVPALAISPPSAVPGQAVGFDSTATVDPDGDPLTYAWSFGDGASGAGAQASHAYVATGAFPVSLTATDATGLSGAATATADVVAPAVGGSGAGATPAPVLSGLSQSARRWLASAVGTTFRFRLNTAAKVRFAFFRRLGSRRIAAGALVRPGVAGTNRMRFRGRLRGSRLLKPGRYTVVVTATDAQGRRSAPRSLSFVVLAPKP